jgi:hypothetical protein
MKVKNMRKVFFGKDIFAEKYLCFFNENNLHSSIYLINTHTHTHTHTHTQYIFIYNIYRIPNNKIKSNIQSYFIRLILFCRGIYLQRILLISWFRQSLACSLTHIGRLPLFLLWIFINQYKINQLIY